MSAIGARPAPPVPPRPPGPVRRTAGTARLVVDNVVLAPVRDGRLRDTGWPAGLRVVVVVSLVGYLAMLLAALLAPWWRASARLLVVPPQATFPAGGLVLVVVGLVLALSALVGAALQLRWWARLPAWLVVAAVAGRPSDASPLDLTSLVWQDVVSLVALGVLAVLMVLPRPDRFRLGEHVLVVLVVGVLVVVAVLARTVGSYGEGLDYSLNTLALVLPLAFWLSTPVAMVAGAALVELTVRAVTWVVTGVGQQVRSAGHRRPGRVLAALAVAVLLARAVQLGWTLTTSPDSAYHLGPALRGLGEGLVLVVVPLLALRLAGRRAGPGRGLDGELGGGLGPEWLLDGWSRRSLPLALVLSGCFFGPLLLGALLAGLLVPPEVVRAVRDVGEPYQLLWSGGVAVLLLVGATGWAIRRGDAATAVLGAALAGYTVFSGLNQGLALDVGRPGVLMAVDLLVVLTWVWLLARRRLTVTAGAALTSVTGVTLLYQYRDVLTEPLTAALALSGAGVGLLAGLVWRLLTDNAWTRGGTDRVPVGARVLLALAGMLFVGLSAALMALHGGTFPLSLDQAEASGDNNLGTALVLGFAAVALARALADGRAATGEAAGS